MSVYQTDRKEATGSLAGGGLLCCLSRSAEERRAELAAFVEKGLRTSQRVICLVDDRGPGVVEDELYETGTEADEAAEQGRLLFLSVSEAFTKNGELAPDVALAWLAGAVDQSIEDGYRSLRVAADMSWALVGDSSRDKVVSFEAALSEFAARHGCSMLTVYELDRCDPRLLLEAVRACDRILLGGEERANPHHVPAGELVGPGAPRAILDRLLEQVERSRSNDEALTESRDLLHSLFGELDVGLALYEMVERGTDRAVEFRVIEASPVLEDINGLVRGEMSGRNANGLFPTSDAEVIEILSEIAITGTQVRFERMMPDTDQFYEVIAFRPKPGLCAVIVTDITQDKQLELTRARDQFRIRQTQKMEAIGRLAGGVAHDFNNILTAIIGLTEVLLDETPLNLPQRPDIAEIQRAATRAGALTRQLLAFSRKQVISPRVIDLNKVIDDSHRMLSRIIGEDVELSYHPSENLGQVEIDPSQVEQVLANFATNARDAMPKGGKLIIETRNQHLDEQFCAGRDDLVPGEYVVFTARDNGSGMTEETRERMFEPFFTTKEKGKGTGLGLATVYGIVRQNKGTIRVESRLGQGTAIEVYLPRVSPEPAEVPPAEHKVSAKGTETVLLAEDEELVRNLAGRILERNGYKVISASSGEEALGLWGECGHRVDCLLTDVVLSGMNGLELFERLARQKRDLKVLYMSGYPEDVISQQGVLMNSIHFIEKPFSPGQLLAKMREAIG